MFAANGTVMTVAGIGTAGSISNVLYLPDLQADQFSLMQAMREGATITLSSDGLVLTVTPQSGNLMEFTFDGSFWKWGDIISDKPQISTMDTSVSLPLPSLSVLTMAHTGAVHEFYCYIFEWDISIIMPCYGHSQHQTFCR